MDINLAVVRGTLTNDPTHRELAGGDTVVSFDVATAVERGGTVSTVSIPVAWRNPTAAAVDALEPGAQVVVTGRVERRFFRSGGATMTRTELVADRCVPARRTKTVRSLLATVAEALVS